MTKPIIVCGEAWGAEESKHSTPFIGASGIELLRMLDDASIIDLTSIDQDYISRYFTTGDGRLIDSIWLLHPEVYRTNVFNIHPPGNRLEAFCGDRKEALPGWPALIKGKFCHKGYLPELERLQDELLRLDPNLVLCLGNTALWALAGSTGVSKRRGTTILSTHCASGFKLLPTYHPAAVLRQWELRPTVIADLMKAKREAEFPDVRRPKREIWIEPSIEDIQSFISLHIRGCSLLSVDIETSGSRVTCIGFAPSAETAIVIPFDDARRKGKCYWPTTQLERQAWLLVRSVLEEPAIPKLFQNGLYDIAFLWRAYGIKTFGATHDSMLAHHALQPESLKGLGFLGSIYTDEGPWKQERTGTETIKRDA